MADISIVLPHAFRFHPTDEEIITHYLIPKVLDSSYTSVAIRQADLNKSEPWELPSIANMGEEWYFFCQKDRKYPTGKRTNRATEAGYWKATGKDKDIFNGKWVLVGMKKTFVFYTGRAPNGAKTNWVMHEFRIEGRLQRIAEDKWVVSMVSHKNMAEKKDPMNGLESYFLEEQQWDSGIPVLKDVLSVDSHLDIMTKVGQISNQSTMKSASQDTAGVSKDCYTEISLLVPRNNMGFTYNFELHVPGSSADPGIDFGSYDQGSHWQGVYQGETISSVSSLYRGEAKEECLSSFDFDI